MGSPKARQVVHEVYSHGHFSVLLAAQTYSYEICYPVVAMSELMAKFCKCVSEANHASATSSSKEQRSKIQKLDLIPVAVFLCSDIHAGMIGARGFTADYALLVTWERMAYGSSPKITQLDLYEDAMRWVIHLLPSDLAVYCWPNVAAKHLPDGDRF